MAVEQNTFKRGGKTYTHFKGTDVNGQAEEYINRLEADEKTGLKMRFYPDETVIKRVPGKGNVQSIFTRWYSALLDSKGDIIEDTRKESSMFTSQPDIISFIAGMGNAIMMSDANGFSYKILGYASMPVYHTVQDANYGKLLTYTVDQENAAPVFSGPGSYGYVAPPAEPTPTV